MTDIDLSPSDYEACDFKKYLEQLRERIVNRTGIPLAFFNDALALLRVVDKLEKEAEWLANTPKQGCHSNIASNCVAASCCTSCPDVNAVCRHILSTDWREAARKAVEEVYELC